MFEHSHHSSNSAAPPPSPLWQTLPSSQIYNFLLLIEMSFFTTSSLQVGTGLVEIAALTTLIGSSSAESLTLGDRGGAGVAWAAVSAFGSLSIIKGCISGASPDWLRQTLGVRSAASDGSTGLRLNLKSKYRSNQDLARKGLDKARGVTVSFQGVSLHTHIHRLRSLQLTTYRITAKVFR